MPTPTPTTTPTEPPVKKAPPLSLVYKGKAKIKAGMEGKSVTTIQEQLNGVGKPSPVNGVFDEQTRKAYKSFQDKFGYWPTGKVTQKPALKLKKLYGNGELPKICRTSNRVLCIDKTQLVLRQMTNGKQKLVTDVASRIRADPHPQRPIPCLLQDPLPDQRPGRRPDAVLDVLQRWPGHPLLAGLPARRATTARHSVA